MKIIKVHLRWHKSFNTNTQDYTDRKKNLASRPWNSLFVPDGEGPYDFIEIPLERDITTIVGANESGKSHLLDAISKVLTGRGNDDRFSSRESEGQAFSVVDLCHFAPVRGKNSDVYPNIGLSFGDLDPEQTQGMVVGLPALAPLRSDIDKGGFTLIVAPKLGSSIYAYLFAGEQRLTLTEPEVAVIRPYLPKVEFIKSNVPLSDEISLQALATAYGGEQHLFSYDPAVVMQVAEELRSLTPWSLPTQQEQQNFVTRVTELQQRIAGAQIDFPSKGQLEGLLFDKILGVTPKTLNDLRAMPHKSRPYVEGQAAIWNSLIKKELNLSQYWQQDPFFALRINIKHGIVFFEITDKTGAIYTFGERSSGLRYFLSYYIQAKALEKTSGLRDTIILMDEPDSFLSTQGQRNLLAVFESLVNLRSANGKTQLVYTTHSPWLINRNFPQRLRLVRKGDGEEGTQFLPYASIRRYEPVRSALGVDCAQTLFMGATNLVVEGPTEQYLLSELTRCFAQPDNLHEFLDLNALVMVSADGAGNVPHLVRSSHYSNEVSPAVAVLLDADEPGERAIKASTNPQPEYDAKGKVIKTHPALLSRGMMATMAEALDKHLSFESESHGIVSVEDLIPASLYKQALHTYLERWQSEFYHQHQEAVKKGLESKQFAAKGLVDGVKELIKSLGLNDKGGYDKIGVAQIVSEIVQKQLLADKQAVAIKELERRLKKLCFHLQELIGEAEARQRKETGADNIRQILRQFNSGRPLQAPISDVKQILHRLESETELLGIDGKTFVQTLNQARRALRGCLHLQISTSKVTGRWLFRPNLRLLSASFASR